jgi:hypothetical protein
MAGMASVIALNNPSQVSVCLINIAPKRVAAKAFGGCRKNLPEILHCLNAKQIAQDQRMRSVPGKRR